MRRRHEELCKEAIVAYMKEIGHQVDCNEHDPDPPDYLIKIDGVEYAFEVTTLSDCYRNAKGKKIPRNTYEESYIRLLEEAEGEAKSKGNLRGVYKVKIPYDISAKFSIRKANELKQRILEYIRDTESDGFAEPMYLNVQEAPQISIEKYDNYDSRIDYVFYDADWRKRILETCLHLIDSMLETKANKLKDFHLSKRIIGLLHDYPHANAGHYREAFPYCVNAGSFDGIFLVMGSGEVIPLKSEISK